MMMKKVQPINEGKQIIVSFQGENGHLYLFHSADAQTRGETASI